MTDSTTLARICTRPAAPDRHPQNREGTLSRSLLCVRRSASTDRVHLATAAVESVI